jgi:hypothetical protein
MENNKSMEKYIKTLNDKERKAYEIAKTHLKSSFNIQKSIGYINYNKSNK